MRQTPGQGSPDSGSTEGLLGDWDIDRSTDGSLPAPADLGGGPPWAAAFTNPADHSTRRRGGGSLRFLQEFSLSDPEEDGAPGREPSDSRTADDTILRRDRPPAGSPTKLHGNGTGRPGTAPASGRVYPSRDLPGPGDVLAGFRIIDELGRGAFARVYVAEEIRLGGRPVAIKVSRAEGDEPKILARLQHTHIVPVHSACDDPVTGLRILCMPFFGGANLAQVLDTAGGLSSTGRTGQSLVAALDQISRRQPASVRETFGPSSRPTGSSHPCAGGAGAVPLPMSDSTRIAGKATPGGSSIAVGFRSLLGRIIGAGASPAARCLLLPEADDPHQPSRQFLGRATAVQAAAWIIARLAEGLDHAHAHGLFHRDLKPANILIADDGTPMLLDFNLAAMSGPSAAGGRIGRAALGGTLPYMAPEHLDAFDPNGTTPVEAVDHRADIYALGLILYEMLAGEHPFPIPDYPPGTTTSEMIRPMIEARRRPPSLRARCPQVPLSLDALVAKCLAFDPDRRYARARDLAEDLRRFLEDLPMRYAPEPSLRERFHKFARRHRALCSSTSIAMIGLAALLVLGAAASAVYSGMQGLVSRFQRQAFERGFTQAQFLLNTADASDRHLELGLDQARALFDRLELADGRRDPAAAWFRNLTDAERARLREEVVELMILEARARVLLASRRGGEPEREAMRRAIRRLDEAERAAGRVPGALYRERARYRAALGETATADRDRRLAARARPASANEWTLLGTTMLASGDPAAAEDALGQAIRLDSSSFWAWFMLGHCHFAQGRFLESAGDFAACTALGPQFAWSHFNRGLALARAGRLVAASDAYDRALAIEPDFAEALVNRALVSLELDRVDSALADLTMAVGLGRRDAGVLAARGEALARLGRAEEARGQLDALLSTDPDNPMVRVARGMIRLADDPDAARADFSRVLARDPRHAQAHYGMALLVRSRDPRAAIEHLDAAIAADPNLFDAIQLRALVRGRLGDPACLVDVDRLLKAPTTRRYYNAACAVALYADKAHEPRRLTQSMELLTRAVDLGFPFAEAAVDPDLTPLRDLPAFRHPSMRSGEPSTRAASSKGPS